MVNWENYEEYMLLLADGELDEAGKAALMEFVAQHPELKKELALYEATRLVPDMEMVYADKSSLTKQTPAKTIALRSWWTYSAAAGVALIIGFMVLRNSDPKVDVAGNTPKDTKTIVKTKDSVILPPAPKVPSPIIKEENQVAVAPKKDRQTTNNQQLTTNSQQPTTNNQQPTTKERTPDLIASLPTNAAKKVSANGIVISPTEHSPELTAIAPAQDEMIEGKKFLAWLPIADEKKQGLNDLKVAVDNTIQKVQSIKETKVVLKIGNKNLLAFNL